jgi:predicted cupin superfamily sugar epimerase
VTWPRHADAARSREDDDVEAEEIIELLQLEPHPEGGHYRETWRGPDGPDGRATATAIYFLLRSGERSHWHRVDASEAWLHHAGSPIRLSIDDWEIVLGPDLANGERPQAVVPAGSWQAAEPTGDWTLVSCVVAPGFEFDGFELAPPGWTPTADDA